MFPQGRDYHPDEVEHPDEGETEGERIVYTRQHRKAQSHHRGHLKWHDRLEAARERLLGSYVFWDGHGPERLMYGSPGAELAARE
jgi:hypothetical protein